MLAFSGTLAWNNLVYVVWIGHVLCCFSSNILKLEVYYKHFNYEVIKEEPTYEVANEKSIVHVILHTLFYYFIIFFILATLPHLGLWRPVRFVAWSESRGGL